MRFAAFPADLKKPPALRAGDTVAIVAPGSPVALERVEDGAAELRRLGYNPTYRSDVTASDTFFAGDHERRYQEFRAALADTSVRAVICARGGYGSNYIVERLMGDGLPPGAPKIVMGYSDITSMLTWLSQQAGWVSFHGPMVTREFAAGPPAYDRDSLARAISSTSGPWPLSLEGASTLRAGVAEGRLFGGCLPMLVATLGTPREVKTAETILFLEDIAAKPYQIDRMLFQLREAGKFRNIRAIVFGEMLECVQSAEQGYTLEQVVLRALDGLDVPIVFGVRSGHTSRGCLTLPLGVTARLAAGSRPKLEILEPAVISG